METMQLGFISLIPTIVMFVFVFWTKRMLLSFTIATLVGSVLIGGFTFPTVWLDKLQTAWAAGTCGYLVVMLSLFGILIKLLDVSGYSLEFANWMGKYANTRRKAMLITFAMGWLIFVDDYLNNMAVSTAMKNICDKHKIPRTLFGFLVNCTAAPVCVLIPVSTWAAFYSGLFEEMNVRVNGTGLGAYIAGMPFLFYPVILLLICFLIIIGVFPLLGITKKDNELAMQTGIVCSKEESLDGKELHADSSNSGETQTKNNPLKFLATMITIVTITIVTKNVMVACMGAIVVVVGIIVFEKKLKLTEVFSHSFEGIASMLTVDATIALALTLVEINKTTGMTDYVITVLTPLLNGSIFAAIVFAFCGAYVFFAGGFWDGSMIFAPIVVPIAVALGVNPLLSCMALVCAATLGSTTFVAGDAVMITSGAVEIKPYYQMLGTFPYALIGYILTIIGFAITGFIVK
ncbi:Na+/H+ antiporter NhaC family protein [Treponema sp. SP13]|uniref:Na+/H+ antiporter NhaC family protein n=1 Tax=Treponema sp. SP13 TaxID=2789742 RepID=UPI003D91D6C4